ncbi:MAG: hypothetical protein JWP91_1681 [Fibrobacteres bacterium]|nr:hypothetical protein [Fibrobacterota bacterium]
MTLEAPPTTFRSATANALPAQYRITTVNVAPKSYIVAAIPNPPKPYVTLTIPNPPKPYLVAAIPNPPKPYAASTIPIPPKPDTVVKVVILPKPDTVAKVVIPPKPDTVAKVVIPPKPDTVVKVEISPKPDTVAKVEIPPKPDTVVKVEIPPKPDTVVKVEIPPKPDTVVKVVIPHKPDTVVKVVIPPKPDTVAKVVIPPKPDTVVKVVISPKPDTVVKVVILPKPDTVAKVVIPPKPDTVVKVEISPKPDTVAKVVISPMPDTVVKVVIPPKPDTVVTVEIPPMPDTVAKVVISPMPDTVVKVEIPPMPDTVVKVEIPLMPDTVVKVEIPPKPDTVVKVEIPPKPDTVAVDSLPPVGDTVAVDSLGHPPLPEDSVLSIDVPGPPNTVRDWTYWPSNTAESGLSRMQSDRYSQAYAAYSEADTLYDTLETSLAATAAALKSNYDRNVASKISSFAIVSIKEEKFEYRYPAGYFGNAEPVAVKAKRIIITALAPDSGNMRKICAYHLNYDKDSASGQSIVFQINGHFGDSPSRSAIGLDERGGYGGAAVGKLAIKGIPIITYDDSRNNLIPAGNLGESWSNNHERDGVIHTLEDLLIVERALLMGFKRVDAIGISGGAERLYHFLALHSCRLETAYLAGFARSAWMPEDNDMRSSADSIVAQVQLADLALIGAQRGTDVVFTQNSGEGDLSKAGLIYDLIPRIAPWFGSVEIHGDDVDGDGMSEAPTPLAHEYDLQDYLHYLACRRGGAVHGRTFHCARVVDALANPESLGAGPAGGFSKDRLSDGRSALSLDQADSVGMDGDPLPVLLLSGLAPGQRYELVAVFDGLASAAYRPFDSTDQAWRMTEVAAGGSGSAGFGRMDSMVSDQHGEIRVQLGPRAVALDGIRGSWLYLRASMVPAAPIESLP